MRTDRGLRRRRGAAGVVAAVIVLGACSPSPSAQGATAVVREFLEAIDDGELDIACGLLAPATREALEEDEGTACPEALTDDERGLALRASAQDAQSSDGSVRVAGRQAQVVAGDDVTFLTISGDSWRITATACTPRTDRPYDCLVEGN